MKYILRHKSIYREDIRKSRFFVIAFPVFTEDDALSLIEKSSDRSANHNCWAFKIGSLKRFSDDGEPSGTAGKPILSAIEYSGLDNTLILVKRYFGGIKLGTGGLVRAYGGVAAGCIRNAEIREIIEYVNLTLSMDHGDSGKVNSLIGFFGFEKVHENYGAHGVEMTLRLPREKSLDFEERLRNELSNRVKLSETEIFTKKEN